MLLKINFLKHPAVMCIYVHSGSIVENLSLSTLPFLTIMHIEFYMVYHLDVVLVLCLAQLSLIPAKPILDGVFIVFKQKRIICK